jgi:hypothetical protein
MKLTFLRSVLKRPRSLWVRSDLAFLESDQGSVRLVVIVLATGASMAALITLFGFSVLRPNSSTETKIAAQLRGEPINSPQMIAPPFSNTSPVVQVQATNPTNGVIKKRHPKPVSFQHRMVEFQVSQAEGSNAQPAAGFGGTPAKVIFSPAQLAALSEPALPLACQKLGFETLSGFPIEVTKEMADGSLNLVAASTATREKIPAAVQAWNNRLVAIRGFLLPLKMNNGLAIEFLLLRNQNMCCFGSVPKINEWICVEPGGEGVKPIMDQPMTIMGKLRVGEIRENGYLVGIYKMQAAQVYIHGAN